MQKKGKQKSFTPFLCLLKLTKPGLWIYLQPFHSLITNYCEILGDFQISLEKPKSFRNIGVEKPHNEKS